MEALAMKLKADDPKCARCGHKKSRHTPDCAARYSCGPSGTFRCMCEGFQGSGETTKGGTR